jgi:hypothetical protein
MKPVRHSIVALLALSAFGLAACSSSPMSRIDANRPLYESWPLEMQSAVLEGHVVTGMTPDMVRMAKGNPSKIETRSGSKGEDEIWIYEKEGSSNVARPRVGVGTRVGGVGVSTGTRVGGGGGGGRNRGGNQGEEVVFQNGVVKRVD